MRKPVEEIKNPVYCLHDWGKPKLDFIAYLVRDLEFAYYKCKRCGYERPLREEEPEIIIGWARRIE